jgi:plasmid stability protein
MSAVPALHIRNVPSAVYEELQERARRNGRSLNAEVLQILSGEAEAGVREGRITRRLRELAEQYPLGPDAPDPVQLIREGRDERTRRLRR